MASHNLLGHWDYCSIFHHWIVGSAVSRWTISQHCGSDNRNFKNLYHFCLDSLKLTCILSSDVKTYQLLRYYNKKCCDTVVGLWWSLPSYHVVILLRKLMDLTREINMNAFYCCSLSLYCFKQCLSCSNCLTFNHSPELIFTARMTC